MKRIPNHYSAKLSELDLATARAVPPGGNWKDVPEDVPSKRLETIRQSYARGEGSRSTYYGRLRPDMPSYTINTYFNRPGNGCHLHYDYDGGQHRVLSQREAARLQSFPDWFEFVGSKTSINVQIGNAVPPVLAYVIARQLGTPGYYLDLFAGAGGLALGFEWAGWKSIIANDIDEPALNTLKTNLKADVICGDIRSEDIERQLIAKAREAILKKPDVPFWVIGGPPCQGFSTAGKARSLDDERNHLFRNYIRILDAVKPDGFVFENVTGLLNMMGGRVFADITAELRGRAESFDHWLLSAEQFGVPQRRQRVILIGSSDRKLPTRPEPLTQLINVKKGSLPILAPAVSVSEALSDLPPLTQGEDGSHKGYIKPPQTPYQMLMRGDVSVEQYLAMVKERCAATVAA